MFENQLTIAVDFDGTIVKDAYPEIGKPMMFAFETLRMLQDKNHKLILWTYRHGRALEAAVDFCKQNGIEFYAVNKSYPEEPEELNGISRKINADIFIDDRNLGGFPGWGEVYQMIEGEEVPQKRSKEGKSGIFSIFNKKR